MSDKEIKPAVKLLLIKNKRILVLKATTNNEDYWILPGGKIKYGESPQQALKREIKEELNCDVKIGKAIGMYDFFTGPTDDGNQIIVTVFDGSIGRQNIDISNNPADEGIKNYNWLTLSELKNKPNTESLCEFISKCTHLKS